MFVLNLALAVFQCGAFDNRMLLIKNLPEYCDDCYTEEDVAKLLLPFGFQYLDDRIYIIPSLCMVGTSIMGLFIHDIFWIIINLTVSSPDCLFFVWFVPLGLCHHAECRGSAKHHARVDKEGHFSPWA